MYGQHFLIAFAEPSGGKAASDALRSQTKYVANLRFFENFFSKLGRSAIDALAASAGIPSSTFRGQMRNNGVDPTALDRNLEAALQANGSIPQDAATANRILGESIAASTGGVVPPWAVWAMVGVGALLLTGGFSRGGGRRRGRRRSFVVRRPRVRMMRFRARRRR